MYRVYCIHTYTFSKQRKFNIKNRHSKSFTCMDMTSKISNKFCVFEALQAIFEILRYPTIRNNN